VYKAVFVDRDGTINRDVPYCGRPQDFELLPTVAQGISLLNKHGFKIIVVTNQSGLARGYFTEEDLAAIHRKMISDLIEKKASIDAVYFCPHHPDDRCDCRKPNTGMFKKAAKEQQIDIAGSYFIGDKLHDMAAANRIECKAVLVPSCEPELSLVRNKRELEVRADFIASDFYSAARWVAAQQDVLAGQN